MLKPKRKPSGKLYQRRKQRAIEEEAAGQQRSGGGAAVRRLSSAAGLAGAWADARMNDSAARNRSRQTLAGPSGWPCCGWRVRSVWGSFGQPEVGESGGMRRLLCNESNQAGIKPAKSMAFISRNVPYAIMAGLSS